MTNTQRTFRSIVLTLALGVVPGCYDNVSMNFADTGPLTYPDGAIITTGDGSVPTYPDGAIIPNLAPWETPNMAMLPAATATDACPEMLTEVEIHSWMGGMVADVHAAGCIHASPAMVWTAIQDPETGHDPGSTNTFAVIRPPTNTAECPGPYETMINAGSPFSVDFRLCWRHAVITGTDASPTLTQSRWQKVWGTSAINVLEGSLVSQPHASDPANITEVFYQYHLKAASTGPTNYETINSYLHAIFSRLVTRSHGTTL